MFLGTERPTEVKVCARRMTSPYGCDPTPNVCQRREVDDNPPDRTICSPAFEQTVVESQEAVLDRPNYCKEQQDDDKLIANVDVSFIDKGLPGRCLSTGGVYEVVQRRRLESLKDRVEAQEKECRQ